MTLPQNENGDIILDDSELEEIGFSPTCIPCRHFRGSTREDDGTHHHTCDAFPDEIPAEIWRGDNNHRKPYPGDNGIQFEPLSRIGAKYEPGMIVHIPSEKVEEVRSKIREEKRAILREFGHDDVEPMI
jgi:hypothetical protein